MSRGPGRWQRLLIDTFAGTEPFRMQVVADIGLDALDRSMSPAEYRALNRAAWQMNGRALHLQHEPDLDCLGRRSRRLSAWTCPKCSPAGTSEHIALLPCWLCRTPTDGRNLRGYGDCGCAAHNLRPNQAGYPVAVSNDLTSYLPIDPVICVGAGGTVTLRGLETT